MTTSKVVVVGVTSLSVSISVDGFPIEYEPECFPAWGRVGMGGVGVHTARTLQTLGEAVTLCTPVGYDLIGEALVTELRRCGLYGPGVVRIPSSTFGVVLVAPDGRRRGHPVLNAVGMIEYPVDTFRQVARDADLAVLTNVRFARPLLPVAQALGVPVAVDVHVIADSGDEYNRAWLEVADVVFCSDEKLRCSPATWVRQIFARYPGCVIAGVGCGESGSVLGLRDGSLVTIEAVAPRGVRNTLGAGDTLFASFLHGWLATGNAVEAIRTASLHAGWKVGGAYPGESFLDEADLRGLRATHRVRAEITRWK